MPVNDDHLTRTYAFRRENPIEREKLELTRRIASQGFFETALDAFAGDGTTSRILASRAQHVLAIEKDKRHLDSLMRGTGSRRISVVSGDNLKVMPLLTARSFALLDLDPYGSCYPQLELAARLMKKDAIVLISSGEIQRVVRGLPMKLYPLSRRFKGRRAVLWAEEMWVPFILRTLTKYNSRIRLVHFFTSPVLMRAVFATQGLIAETESLQQRSRYLGWFARVLNENNRK